MIHRTYRTRFSRSIAFNQILLGSKCCQIESVSIKHCSKRTATNHFSPGGANLPVNIVGIPHRKLPQKIRYKPGQFFIHEKTPYRGIIVENLHTNVFKLDEEKNLPELMTHFVEQSQCPNDYQTIRCLFIESHFICNLQLDIKQILLIVGSDSFPRRN